MATFTVGASTDDARMSSITNDSGRNVTTSGIVSLTDTTLSPGSHGSNDEWSIGARFANVTVAQGATISSATYSMKAVSSYSSGGTIAYLVSAQAADNAGTFVASGGNLNTTSRPRSTAVSSTWNQNSVTAGTRYSIDVTSVIQEIVNRAGWASGNAIVMLVDTDASTTQGEWQDYYGWDDTTDRTNNPPQLSITTGAAPTFTLIGHSAVDFGLD